MQQATFPWFLEVLNFIRADIVEIINTSETVRQDGMRHKSDSFKICILFTVMDWCGQCMVYTLQPVWQVRDLHYEAGGPVRGLY